MSQKLKLEFRVVLYREEGFWIAHCLEMDVMGHGQTKKSACSRLMHAVRTQLMDSVQHHNVSNIFQPADARFFEMYSAGKDVGGLKCELTAAEVPPDDVEIERFDTREYDDDLVPMA